ncbi:MAG: sulfite exporter TauE/SafE family protein [Thiotrichaceae bacterium]|nr:sulfite exporter TauE/SafE family protein [Thiotrichaceae bacterium]
MEYLLYLGIGAIAGLFAGLLGIGGGLIIVPALLAIYIHLSFQGDQLMQLALGTSLATILFTSLSSVWAHHQRGAVQWDIVKKLSIGILLGAMLGGLLAKNISGKTLQYFFAFFELYVAIQMLRPQKEVTKKRTVHNLPNTFATFGIGIIIGKLSSLLGIGGGTLTVPFLHWCNVSIHKAIASSAACGIPIAIAGTLGYIIGGWGQIGLPEYSLGYIHLPSMLGIVLSSVLFAPLGAKISYKLNIKQLKHAFAGLLLILSVYLFASA